MNSHRPTPWYDKTIEWTRGRWDRGYRWAGRHHPTVSSGAVLLFVFLAIATGFYAISEAATHRRDDRRRDRDEQCLVQLQQLTADRAKALTAIQNDDRAAQAALNARWARDVVTGNIRDIPKAYEAFRVDFNANQTRRAGYGLGITVSSACQFAVVKAGRGSSLPSQSPAAPSSRTASAPPTGGLPPLPSIVLVTRTRTVPGPTTTLVLTATVRPGRATVTATATRTTTAHPAPRPTVTKTVTKTVTCPAPTGTAHPCK
jgi:hypothetical protein